MLLRLKNGQSVLEYAILLSVLAAVFVAMAGYVKRATKARILVVQNQINIEVP